jgi:hypothetical protein
MKFKVIALFVVAVLSVSGSFVAVATPVTTTTNPAGLAVDPSIPAYYGLGVCTLAQQLDCIESVQVKGLSGGYLNATEFGTQTWTIETDINGNTMHSGDPSWTSTPTGATPFSVAAQMFTPSFTGDDGSTLGVLGVWVDGLPAGFSIKVTLRTSWLKAQNLQFIANEASYTKESITGGNRWTFSGTQAKVAVYNLQSKIELTMQDPMDWSAQADEDLSQLDSLCITRERLQKPHGGTLFALTLDLRPKPLIPTLLGHPYGTTLRSILSSTFLHLTSMPPVRSIWASSDFGCMKSLLTASGPKIP